MRLLHHALALAAFTATLAMHAQPAFRSASSAAFSGTTCTVNTPAGVVAGDVMIACVAFNGFSALPTITPPSGWTTVSSDQYELSARVAVYSRVVDAAEPSSHAWSTGLVTGGGVTGIMAFSGINTAAPVDVIQGVSGPPTQLALAPSVTPNFSPAMVLAWYAGSGSTTWIPNAGLTEAIDISSASPIMNASLCGSYLFQSTASATGQLLADQSSSSSSHAYTLALRAANIPPTGTNLNAPEVVIEDTPQDLTNIVVGDANATNLTATLTLSNPAVGSLSTATVNSTTSSYNNATGVWTATGPAADLNTLLAGLIFNPALNYYGSFTLGVQVSDGALSVTGTKAFTVEPENDAPTLSAPTSFACALGKPLMISVAGLNGITVNDVDDTSLEMDLDFTLGSASVTLATTAGLTFTQGDGTADNRMIFQGTKAAINAALNGMVVLMNTYGNVANVFTVTDLGGGLGMPQASVSQSLVFQVRNLQVNARVVLQGAYDATTGLMNDNLRSAGLVPLTQPFTALGYQHLKGGGAEVTTPAVLAVTGPNAIVDWVLVEKRNSTGTTVLCSTAALLQRDGDLVEVNGTSPVKLHDITTSGAIVVRHRNHLGVMSGNLSFSTGQNPTPTAVDLTLAATATYGTNARTSITGAFPVQALWAGDVNFNGNIGYTGTGNDRDPILLGIGGTTPNNVLSGYASADVNLDGQIKYTGANNDRDPILLTVGSTTPNTVRLAQVP